MNGSVVEFLCRLRELAKPVDGTATVYGHSVSGVGINFATQMRIGDRVRYGDGDQVLTARIIAIQSPTSMMVEEHFIGSVAGVLMRRVRSVFVRWAIALRDFFSQDIRA